MRNIHVVRNSQKLDAAQRQELPNQFTLFPITKKADARLCFPLLLSLTRMTTKEINPKKPRHRPQALASLWASEVVAASEAAACPGEACPGLRVLRGQRGTAIQTGIGEGRRQRG